jgi:ADP-ribose pyrophosphatase YjhB (NUDIX family)
MTETMAELPVKQAVAIVIKDESDQFLSVRRPDDDASLPGVWGLPAVSLAEGETLHDAAMRAGLQKLGVRVRVGRCVGDERIARRTFVLHLTEFEVEILGGTPAVPQPDATVTQYADLRYTTDLTTLFDAARMGSACSRIFLRDNGVDWG